MTGTPEAADEEDATKLRRGSDFAEDAYGELCEVEDDEATVRSCPQPFCAYVASAISDVEVKMKYNPCAVLCLVMLPLLTFTTLFCIPVEYVSQIANQFDRLAGEPPLLHPFSYSSSWESVSIPGFKFNFNLTSNSSLLMTNRTYDSAWYLNKSLAFPPYPCIVARATDIFLNASATGCRAWCRRELGPSSGLLHALSPLHWLLVQRSWDFVFSLDYGMCFKAETSAWALTWFPSQFLSWLVASTYGSIAIITFFCKLVACPREFVASGPSPNEMRPNDQAVKPWHEPPFTNDRARSQFQLSRSAIFLLMETAQDLLSIIMFLRFGQPVYAMGMCFFVLCSRLHAGDVFQVGGAGALARSLARGFATKEMYQHFASEVIEGMGGTLIQLYALFVGRYENDAFAILCINVYTSLMVTVPNGFEAWSLLHRDVQEFFDDYYAVQKLRSQTSWLWKFLPSLLAVLIAAVASANAPSEGSRFLNETFVRREVLKAYRIPSTDKERFVAATYFPDVRFDPAPPQPSSSSRRGAKVSLEKLRDVRHGAHAILSVDFAPSSAALDTRGQKAWKLITAGQDGKVKVWSLSMAQPSALPRLLVTMKHEAPVACARWSPDAMMIASCDAEATLMVWAPGPGHGNVEVPAAQPGEVAEYWHRKCFLPGHEGEICDVSWHPNLHPDFTLASCSHDGTIRLWSLPVGELCTVLRLPGESAGYVKGVAFDPLGRYLATMSDGTGAASRPHATLFECPDAVGAGRSADGWRLVPLSQEPWAKPGPLMAAVGPNST
ncbi:Protein HIRA [Symbiodinium microadriaticum]|uniref:Protein HIRA n=1 Tax=Symbiodinium microadriaticum TaxID=2951 RepID=A0A1Q9E2V0_SYMMI|nr:Protein HIRA [Symbiodinium microadriaticum]